MGKNNWVGYSTRNVALRTVAVFLCGTLVGSVVPESGNVLAHMLEFPEGSGHFFNPCFLVIGIIGIVLALFVGHKTSD